MEKSIQKIEKSKPEFLESSQELFELVSEDQADRRSPDFHSNYLSEVAQRDTKRRKKLEKLIEQGVLKNKYDYYSAGLIFQHGQTPEDYLRAQEYTWKAHEMGHKHAGHLYACTVDRYLGSIGELQKYGTQYQPRMKPGPDGHEVPDNSDYYLLPVDPATTDEERIALGTRTLQDAKDQASNFNQLSTKD